MLLLTLSLKSGECFARLAHVGSDEPHSKGSAAAGGQQPLQGIRTPDSTPLCSPPRRAFRIGRAWTAD